MPRFLQLPMLEPSTSAREDFMAHRNLIVVGASAGGVEALRLLVGSLPQDLQAAVLIVLHMPADSTSVLSRVLSRMSSRIVRDARHGQKLAAGSILVAPTDHHLVVSGDHVELTRGPRVNGHRPAVDPLFFSAARWRGPRAIGIVLSGSLDDGSAGMRAITRSGGRGIVQDPAEALYSDMPIHALREAPSCETLPLAQMGERLAELIREEVPDHAGTLTKEELRETEQDMESSEEPAPEGRPSAFSCPDCHGVLWEVGDGELVRYRCRVGHAFSPATLSAQQVESLEEALWAAYRALRENTSLAIRLAERAKEQGLERAEQVYRERARDSQMKAETIEAVLDREPERTTRDEER